MDILSRELDPDQREAVANTARPLLVLAGPGSGKTRMLTHRIGYLFRSQPRTDFKVLALTFTNKAAREMSERLVQMPDYRKDRAFVGTFHQFCREILQAYACYIGRSRQFTILDPDDQKSILRECLAEVGMTQVKPEGITGAIEAAQRRMLNPSQYANDLVSRGRSPRAAEVYRVYENRKRMSEVLDFNDLILLSIQLLRHMPSIQNIYQDVYEFVCIDECQDTNLAQLELIKLLISQKNKSLLAVADEDQLIYEWNEARVENLNDLREHFNLSVFNLNRNYRCPPDVLSLANQLIVNNKRRFTMSKKDLVPVKKSMSSCYTIMETKDEFEEAELIVETIRKERADQARQYGDFAVIARNRFLFDPLKGLLEEADIPFVLFGDESFLQQHEVAVYLHAFNVVYNPDDFESLKRLAVYLESDSLTELGAIQNYVYKTGKALTSVFASDVTIAGIKDQGRFMRIAQLHRRLHGLKREESSIYRLFTLIEDLFGIQASLLSEASEEADKKLTNIEALEDFIAEFEATAEDRSLGSFNAEALLKRSSTDRSSVDKADPSTVKLLTIHAGKGTEYPVVFLMGLEEGTLPDYRSVDSEAKTEEERRSCYVAVTRTMDHLYLSWSVTRRDWGKQPSRFLIEMGYQSEQQ